MNGRDDWSKFAEANGLTWEEGPPKPWDQHGKEYLTIIASDFEFESNLKKVLGGDRHVIVRMFPHCADPSGKVGATRMRLTSYSVKP